MNYFTGLFYYSNKSIKRGTYHASSSPNFPFGHFKNILSGYLIKQAAIAFQDIAHKIRLPFQRLAVPMDKQF